MAANRAQETQRQVQTLLQALSNDLEQMLGGLREPAAALISAHESFEGHGSEINSALARMHEVLTATHTTQPFTNSSATPMTEPPRLSADRMPNDIEVTLESVQAAQADVQKTYRALISTLAELEDGLKPMINMWIPGAHAAYLSCVEQWDVSAASLSQVLNGVGRTLHA
jgi:uncharacterized protein YukE